MHIYIYNTLNIGVYRYRPLTFSSHKVHVAESESPTIKITYHTLQPIWYKPQNCNTLIYIYIFLKNLLCIKNMYTVANPLDLDTRLHNAKLILSLYLLTIETLTLYRKYSIVNAKLILFYAINNKCTTL